MSDAAPPICNDCRHRVRKLRDGVLCNRVLTTRHDPVEGPVRVRLNAPAHRERASDRTLFGRTRCGPDGRFFDPIPRLTDADR